MKTNSITLGIIVVAIIICAYSINRLYRYILRRREEKDSSTGKVYDKGDGDEDGRFSYLDDEVDVCGNFKLFKDNATGVLYLSCEYGFTVLCDESGRPIFYNKNFKADYRRFLFIPYKELSHQWKDLADSFDGICVDTDTNVVYLVDDPGIAIFIGKDGFPILYHGCILCKK